MRMNEMIPKGKRFDHVLILSTSSLRKCMQISLDNLHADIGDLRVNTIRRWRFKETEVLPLSGADPASVRGVVKHQTSY